MRQTQGRRLTAEPGHTSRAPWPVNTTGYLCLCGFSLNTALWSLRPSRTVEQTLWLPRSSSPCRIRHKISCARPPPPVKHPPALEVVVFAEVSFSRPSSIVVAHSLSLSVSARSFKRSLIAHSSNSCPAAVANIARSASRQAWPRTIGGLHVLPANQSLSPHRKQRSPSSPHK